MKRAARASMRKEDRPGQLREVDGIERLQILQTDLSARARGSSRERRKAGANKGAGCCMYDVDRVLEMH